MTNDKPMEEVKLHNTMDAKIWTDEFMRLHPEGQQDLKWDDMIGWFANAIMVGYDHGRWKLEPELSRQAEEIDGLKKALDICKKRAWDDWGKQQSVEVERLKEENEELRLKLIEESQHRYFGDSK